MGSLMTDNITTTGDLTRLAAHVIDALSGYDHLPALGSIGVSQWGRVYLSPRYDFHKNAEVRQVCLWADAFGVPVVIDLSSSGEIAAVLDLNGVEARLDKYITHRQAYEYGAALGIPVSPGGQVQVEAAALLAVLDQQYGVAV
ncbi:hypothetical protein [Actinophytocola sp.]|uniref:hypothetical protein n=1 Tax=Actinophytocola sp. TaxID=1872138 RepID=UPI002D6F598C|nr:hypothetical protein [Actinophytocola sp.]HYQ66170.1 hypothetical protein [Actinophytocola sp.]